jgi:metallo-beta-lactamase family protein
MFLTFHGAAHEVTGSCYLLETKGARILIDFGMFQGSDFNEGKNHDVLPFDPKTIDAVLVTHAHLDHTGRIPRLAREGFKGKIFSTKPTLELARLIWEDAFSIMTYNNKKFQSPILYNEDDIARAVSQCTGVAYREEVVVAPGIKAVFKDAGHIFGSSFIEVTAEGKTVIFSGDLGNSNVPILRETDQLGRADVLLIESTYGDRRHEGRRESRNLFLSLIKEGVARGGTIMVPAFSIERIQEMLYDLYHMNEEGTLPRIPIFLDSPLAIHAMPIYKKYPEYYDYEAAALFRAGEDFFDFPNLTLTTSRDESKSINEITGPKMIIAGAGMMNGGRIVHHAYRYLSDPKSTLLFTGYQAQHTLGRRLYEGAETVQIFHETIPVRCTVKAIGGLSAHADQEKLVSWVRGAEALPKKVYCVHGEPTSATTLGHRLRDELGLSVFIPDRAERVEI